MAEWRSRNQLEDHFVEHGRELGCRSIEEYDASAQATLDIGTYFEYDHEDAGEYRTGCYDQTTGRFVALDEDGKIVTHFACPEWYVRILPDSNYDA